MSKASDPLDIPSVKFRIGLYPKRLLVVPRSALFFQAVPISSFPIDPVPTELAEPQLESALALAVHT